MSTAAPRCEQQPIGISQLGDEPLACVFSHLDTAGLATAELVCRHW